MQVVWIERLLLAAGCGGLIGYERTRRLKNAGIRTHVIVAIGAALAMIISKYGFTDVLILHGMRLDPARIGAQIISGISFIGAGTILLKGEGVNGLTTAAGVWTTAIVGLAIGAGMEGLGLTAAVLILLVQYLLRENTIFKFLLRQKHFHCRLVLENKGQSLTSIRQLLEQAGFRRQSMTISSVTPAQIILIIDAQLTAQENIDLLLLTLSQQAMVLQVKREDWQN
jgi:putative Mg2+ transporter-C (MgtC) family protein